MTSQSQTFSTHASQVKRVTAPLGFDWLFTLLAAFFVIGLFVDGWAHNHGRVDESFFTPWHALFYSGFAIVAGALFWQVIRNRRAGLSRREAIPAGYEYALLGVFVFGGGGVGDLIWHSLFGIEEDVEALLSPTHMLLVIGMVLIVSGPFRAAWLRRDQASGWAKFFPIVLSVTLFFSVISFITQFAHPMLQPWAAVDLSSDEMGGEIFTMNADGSGQTRLTRSVEAFDTHPSFSSDGSQVVFASETENGYEIFIMDADGSNIRQLTQNETQDWNPAWSPGGNLIAFTSEATGSGDIYVMDTDGTHLTQLTHHEANDWQPAWSPDGQQIAFVSEREDSAGDIYIMNTDGSGLVNLTNHAANDGFPTWSPDGNSIAFVSDRGETLQIYVVQVDTLEVNPVTSAGVFSWSPAWSPAGDQIAFVSDQNGDDDIYLSQLDGTGLINLTNNPAMNDGFPAWSQDGEQIVYRARGMDVGLSLELSQSLGVASIILQSALLMGVVLLLVRRWTLPFGAFTLLFTLNAIGMTLMDDEFRFLPVAFLTGLLADFLYRWLRPSFDNPRNLRWFAFTVPFAFYALYFATLFLTDTVTWTIHFWAGAIVIAGLVGVLMSFLARPVGEKTVA